MLRLTTCKQNVEMTVSSFCVLCVPELRSTIKTNEDLLKRKIEEIQEIHKTDYELSEFQY